jgi:hypothetical protein
MMGTVEFNSACFYRYSNVDLGQLLENLGNDEELARATLAAFVRDRRGDPDRQEQHGPPEPAVLRDGGAARWRAGRRPMPSSPVAPGGDDDLATRSIQALDGYWGKLATMYGDDDVSGLWCVSLGDIDLTHCKALRPPCATCSLAWADRVVQRERGAGVSTLLLRFSDRCNPGRPEPLDTGHRSGTFQERRHRAVCAALGGRVRPMSAISPRSAWGCGRSRRNAALGLPYRRGGLWRSSSRRQPAASRAVQTLLPCRCRLPGRNGLQGRALLETLDAALRPHWQLFPGRKAFVPGAGVVAGRSARRTAAGCAAHAPGWATLP